MARITRAAAHVSLQEVKSRSYNDPRPWCRLRWLILSNALVDPRKAEEIAKQYGVSKATMHQIISLYHRFGGSAVETPGKGGRRDGSLSLEEEQHFLAPFFARAETGESATAAEVQRAFEARVGHEVDDSSVYRLLHRHGWCKLLPRSKHLKASREAQEQCKKTDAAQVQAAVATRPAVEKRPVLFVAQHASPLWPYQSPQTLLGPSRHAASCPVSSGARVGLRLRYWCTFAWPHDLSGAACCEHGHEETLSQSGGPNAGAFLYRDASRASWLASVQRVPSSCQHSPH